MYFLHLSVMKPQNRTNFQFLLVLKNIVIFVKDVLRMLYTCTFMLLYACLQRYVRVCVCGGLKSTSGDFLSQPPTPTCVLRQDLLLNPELTNSLRPANELQESAFLLFPSWDNRYLPRSPAFYKGARDPNSSPLACTAHSLSTQPFPLT